MSEISELILLLNKQHQEQMTMLQEQLKILQSSLNNPRENTNQSNSVYKMLSNLAALQQPVRERFKFWSDMKRKPGETITELASRIRQDAATCDFIKDPLDEALRTKFICSVDN